MSSGNSSVICMVARPSCQLSQEQFSSATRTGTSTASYARTLATFRSVRRNPCAAFLWHRSNEVYSDQTLCIQIKLCRVEFGALRDRFAVVEHVLFAVPCRDGNTNWQFRRCACFRSSSMSSTEAVETVKSANARDAVRQIADSSGLAGTGTRLFRPGTRVMHRQQVDRAQHRPGPAPYRPNEYPRFSPRQLPRGRQPLVVRGSSFPDAQSRGNNPRSSRNGR